MLKIAVIGAGFGTSGLLPAFEAVPGCKVVAVARTRSQWRTALNTPGLGAVAIATPPRAQYRIAKAALAKGLHVFAEKPLAANVTQAKELLALARKKRLVHGVDFMFPEINEWKKVKQLLDSKKFGKLKHINVRWEWLSNDVRLKRWSWRTKRGEGGGALSFYFSHGLYYLEQFAGKISKSRIRYEYARGNPNDGEAGFDLALTFASGATGSVHLSSSSHGPVMHRLEFECERGTIVLENRDAVVDNFTVKTYTHLVEKRVPVSKDKGVKNQDERVKAIKKLARRFVRACRSGRQMHPSFAEGLRVQELVETIRSTKM